MSNSKTSTGSGMSEAQYERNKQSKDNFERLLVEHGTKPSDAKKIADRIAQETDNRRRQEGKG